VSGDLLTEYREVPTELEAQGKITREQMKVLVAGIASFVSGARLCTPRKNLAICRDPEDNMIVDCCLAARAKILVTGDRDLLDITPDKLRAGGLRGLKICNPAEYLR